MATQGIHYQLNGCLHGIQLPVVVGPSTICICPDLDVVNVLASVCLLPQFLDNLVDVCHLGGVECQQRLLKSLNHQDMT